MSELDPRLNAYRDDLADARLTGKVQSERFTEGANMQVVSPFADLCREPRQSAGLDTQILHGDQVTVFEQSDGWCWVQSHFDDYVGYVREETLGGLMQSPTHMISHPRTFRYTQPDLKSPRSGYLSIGSKVVVEDQADTRGTSYLILADGTSIVRQHAIAVDEKYDDPIEVAETLLHAPYLWGGATGFGLDCSGLVSIAYRLCGHVVLRDTDMQVRSLGDEIVTDAEFSNLQRGDLVFWKGHVGMMADANTLLHANGHSMNVALEPLADAIERIGYLYGQPTSVRRKAL